MDITDSSAILESISDGVFTVDTTWRITFFNRAAERITGVDRSEAVGAFCFDVFRSSICGPQCALRRSMESAEPVINRACYFINSSGESVPISISTAVLHDDAGNVAGGAETFRDLSEIEALKREISGKYSAGSMSSSSPRMEQVMQLISVVAPTSSTVLIQGETGTGKEVAARTIHELSEHRSGPFKAVNCAALPENLLESELFGHVKGAFTGAVADKQGLFAQAGRGTLFLDEIGDISPAMQVKLLRVLQEREFQPVGSSRTCSSNARIIAATNRDLKGMIEQGTFREDLYFRLKVIAIPLPPLRERVEDIPALAEVFLRRYSLAYNKSIESITPDVFALFRAYSWPGNIRELENVMERAVIVSAGREIDIASLPQELMGSVQLRDGAKTLREQRGMSEKQTILSALKECGYNRQKTADYLGVHKTTLFRKIKALEITIPR
ncbi:MAG: sigma-54 interaction domain-containing protein [Fibrobacterota bacterium]